MPSTLLDARSITRHHGARTILKARLPGGDLDAVGPHAAALVGGRRRRCARRASPKRPTSSRGWPAYECERGAAL
jgi:hypothetical protein